MPEPLPLLAPKTKTPVTSAGKAPLNLLPPKVGTGTKPGVITSPLRINPPAAAAGVAAAETAATSTALGAAATVGGALLLAIPQILLLEEPAAAPELLYQPDPVFVEAPNVPFKGGQGQGIPYTVYWQDAHPDFSNRPIQAVSVFGAVVGAIAIIRNPSPNYYEYNLVIRAKDAQGLATI